jgi:hypothetical protein
VVELTGDPARHRRYGLLLDEALRRCPDGGGDDLHAVAVLRPCRGALSRARDAVKAACGSVDASVDAAAVLSSLSVSWRLPWLAVPQRVLLHRGPLAKSTKRGGTRRVVAAVCNDLLLYGTEGKAFRLRKVIPIAAAVVVDASLVLQGAAALLTRSRGPEISALFESQQASASTERERRLSRAPSDSERVSRPRRAAARASGPARCVRDRPAPRPATSARRHALILSAPGALARGRR